jgi:hypothetical protein
MDAKSGAWGLIAALFAAPLGLLLGRRLLAQAASTEADAPAAPPEILPHTAPPRPPVLAIVATSLRLPHGDSAPALARALAGNQARADLDPVLADEDGVPVTTARSIAARGQVLQDAILAWLAANGLAELRYDDEQWRALILATRVTAELAGQAAHLLMPAADASRPPRPLRLIPLLPPDWGSAQRRAAAQWLEHTVEQAGWPAACIERARTALPGPDEASPAAPFGHLAHDAVLSNAPLSALVVACASHVGAASVARWAADGSLFSASRPQGRIPGEGAAGVLVLDERQAGAIEGAAGVRLDALREARTGSPAATDRELGPALLAGLVKGALDHAGAAPADVAMVVADTGEHLGRVRELMGSVAALPQLDPVDDIARIGIACGSCGAVSFIAALALARHHALERAAPVLCVSNEDDCRRIAALVRPPALVRPAPQQSHSRP